MLPAQASAQAAPAARPAACVPLLDHTVPRLQDDASALLVEWQHDREQTLMVRTPTRA